MIRKVQSITIALLLATNASCLAPSDDNTEPAVLQPQKPAEIPTYSYRVVCAFPHDPTAFTQGLLYDNGFLYESTGQYGQSTLRKVELETGTVVQLHQLDERFFAEGLALFGNRLLQLTWRANKGFAYNLDSFEPLAEFTYPTEGWGLTYDGELLIMSDGSATLYFRDPFTFAEVSRVAVAAQDQPRISAQRTGMGRRRGLCQHLADRHHCPHRPGERPSRGVDRPDRAVERRRPPWL